MTKRIHPYFHIFMCCSASATVYECVLISTCQRNVCVCVCRSRCAVPLVTAYLLLRNFRAKTLHSEDTLERMGGIYQYYKTNYLMWESLFLFRVLFLVFIQVRRVHKLYVQIYFE